MSKLDARRNRVIDLTSGGYFDDDARRRAGEIMAEEMASPQSSGQFVYGRYANVTVHDTEAMLVRIEGEPCAWAVLTASGMAAIDAALSVFHDPADDRPWLFASEIYGGTKTFLDLVMRAKRGAPVRYVDVRGDDAGATATERMIEGIRVERPSLVYFEPVTNPLLIVLDAPAIIRAAKEVGAAAIVDNTFGTPLLLKPLALGADLVVHSVTKYLSGHGDLTAGAVCGAEGGRLPPGCPALGTDGTLRDAVRNYRKFAGAAPNPLDAYRLGTELRTFALRVQRQMDNAARLARFLEGHERVRRVLYPGLPGHPSHATARRLFGNRDFGAIVTFELEGGAEAALALMNRLDGRIDFRPTLGDTESILLHVPQIFRGYDAHPGMIRLSVGIEEPEELQATVAEALAGV